MSKFRVRTPATSANLGPGFDCLGIALGLYNQIDLATDAEQLVVSISGEGVNELPRDADNLTIRAMDLLYQTVGLERPPLRIIMDNQIPLNSGLGSSAAAIVGGLTAANALLGQPMGKDEILKLAVDMEHHPDNVTPALFGGLAISSIADGKLIHRRVKVPEMLAVVAMPRVFVSTAEQRAALPQTIPYADAVANLGYVALVVKALSDGDVELLCHAVTDRLHVPYRRAAIPGYDELEALVQAEGAAITISGAGPSVIAFTQADPDKLGKLMVETFQAAGDIEANYWVLPINQDGASVEVLD